jgi:serine/threonine protein kinase
MSIGSPGANDFTQETQQEQPPQKTGVEQLDPECEGADWQSLSFPNCNSVHEIDLEAIQRRQAAGNENVGALSGGDGHYRAVWAVDPSSISREVLALKIMRGEREIHERNFDRHRRDALTMERLTSSPYIVDIYGFCGNTVLNEFIGETLMDVILDDQQGDDAASSPTRKTPEGRVRLALDVAKGVEAIHSIPGGPIVHADIQPGQFLMAADGTVKLNDFNRCRFMTRSTKTGNLCPFHIAQAGGETRSPEEYNIGELDAKMDIFSTANVLYSILSGEQAWTHWTSEEAQELVKAGLVLRVPDEFRTPDTLDGSLTNLTEQAYRFYPAERISAADLVKGLEGILSKSSMRDPSELGGRLVDQQTG